MQTLAKRIWRKLKQEDLSLEDFTKIVEKVMRWKEKNPMPDYDPDFYTN